MNANDVYRDFVTDGVASSGQHPPRKAEIRELLTGYEAAITAFSTNGGLIFDTRANLFASLAHDANASAWVILDPTVGYNGIYRKIGASGAGSWTRVADLPYSFIRLNDAGAGTANAIIATSSIPLPSAASAALLVMNVFEANTGPVTIAANGAAAKPLKTNSGNDLAASYLTAGMMVSFIDDGTNFRLLSDVASAAIVAAAEAAAAIAVAAKEAAESAAGANLSSAESRAAAILTTIPALVNYVRTAGYAAAGDGGEALYKKVGSEPSHAGKFQSADGAWWEIVFEDNKVVAAAMGVFGGGVGDHTVAIQTVIDTAPVGSEIIFPKSIFRFKHILIEKSVVLNWGMSELIVDPSRDSLSSALPAMLFQGAVLAAQNFSTVNPLVDRVNLLTGSAGDTFAAGDYVRILDDLVVPAWDGGAGHTGRGELNRVRATTGPTVNLEKSMEWSYSSAATARIAKVNPLLNPGVKNIGKITEPDPGALYTGTTVLGPHLIAFSVCVNPKVENVKADRWQMHVCQFHFCQDPVIENCEARYPYRPELGGHGYFVQFTRCNRGLARRNSGFGVRHLVDWTQCYDCKSVFNTAYAPNGTQFAGHGQGAKRSVSEDDTVHFGGGVRCAGWGWGNPSFSADYDLTIVRPKAYGRCDGIESSKVFRCSNLADGLTVLDPTVDIYNSVVAQYAMVFAVEAGKNVSVQGGRIDIQWLNGGTTSDSVLYARTMSGVKCENISFRDVRMVGARSDNSYILRVEDILGVFSVKNCTLRTVDTTVSGIFVSGASEELDLTENRFLNGGFRGISVTTEPTRNKRIRDNVFQGPWTATLHGVAV